MLSFVLDPAHPADVPFAIAATILSLGSYLVYCQREHVKRKARRRVTSIR